MDQEVIVKRLLDSTKFSVKPEFYSRYDCAHSNDIDPYGFDTKTIKLWMPLFRFLYEGYFDVKTVGLENIPDEGRAILIGNHTGVLPMDAFMTITALLLHHNSPRRVRCLAHNFLRATPIFDRMTAGFGAVPAEYSVAKKLLEDDELVFFYPEGARGTGKPFSMRYRLMDFDPGFVKAAIETNSPIIPITTIGGDEIFPLLGNIKSLARVLGAPYFPVTPAFPWLPFPVNITPLPIKFLIKIGKPIHLDYPPEKAKDRKLRLQIARDFQYEIQRDVNELLRQRKSPFVDW